jgi:hypothetical protein
MSNKIESEYKMNVSLVEGRLLLAGHEFAVDGKTMDELMHTVRQTLPEGGFNPIALFNGMLDLCTARKLAFQVENGLFIWHVAPDTLVKSA